MSILLPISRWSQCFAVHIAWSYRFILGALTSKEFQSLASSHNGDSFYLFMTLHVILQDLVAGHSRHIK